MVFLRLLDDKAFRKMETLSGQRQGRKYTKVYIGDISILGIPQQVRGAVDDVVRNT